MTDEQQALDAIARAANDLVPQLTERLVRHGLGEIEVSSVTSGSAWRGRGHPPRRSCGLDVRQP